LEGAISYFAQYAMLREQISNKEAIEITAPRTGPWQALLARRGIAAYLPVIIVAILMFFAASWQYFWIHDDAARFQCYALTFWLGGSAAHLLPSSQCAFFPASTLLQ